MYIYDRKKYVHTDGIGFGTTKTQACKFYYTVKIDSGTSLIDG